MPTIFNWTDFFTLGAVAILVTILGGVVVLNRKRNPGKAWWQWAGLGLVVAMFWAGYVMVLAWRTDLVDRVVCVTSHGLIMVQDGGVSPDCTAVEFETERVVEAWRRVPSARPGT